MGLKKKISIGIPKALLYYYYIPLWKTFFEELGFEILISDNTSKEMLNKGIKVSVQEICVPIKVFNSHVIDLIGKGTDYIFIPRMVSIRKKETFCPKFLGLPDMSISIFKELGSKMISPEIREKNERISGWKNYRIIGEMFSIPDKEIKAAIKKAGRVWDDFRAKSLRGFAINDILQKKAGSGADAGTDSGGRPEERRNGTAPAQSSLKLHSNVINIGLMGYVYNICDNYISMDIIGKLKEKGINVITFEMLGPEIPYSNLKHLRKPLFWTFSNYLLGAGHYFLDQENIDGIIHVTAFGCGPDSYIGKMMELLSEEKKKPFLTIRVDEHSGESHLITRVEAFTDMIERKKALDEGRISLS